MNKVVLFLLLAVVTVLSGCGLSVAVKHDHDNCETDTQRLAPGWVQGGIVVPGYYNGVGVATIKGDGENALVMATQKARADLSASIQSSVSRMIKSHVRELRRGGVSLTQADNEIITKTTTQLSLGNVQRVDTWRDGKSCQLWVLVRVDESTVEKNLAKYQSKKMLSRAEGLYEMADDTGSGLDVRIEQIEKALAILEVVKFELLPTQKRRFYRGPYEKRLSELLAQVKTLERLVLINANGSNAEGLKPEVASFLLPIIDGSWHKQQRDCKSLRACLVIARKVRAKHLVLIDLATSFRDGSMGSRIGAVNIKYGFYDVLSGRAAINGGLAKGEVFSFGDDMDWRLAVQRAFEESSIKAKLNAFMAL